MKSYEEINARIRRGEAVVLTAEEVIPLVREHGPAAAARKVDVVTCATFGAMCSSGAFLNLGHAEPPTRLTRVLLNGVPAYGGLAAVDVYLGATERSSRAGYGGAHVIEDLCARRPVHLRAWSRASDCYPGRRLEGWIHLDHLNQAYLFNPRNAYQNYAAAANSSPRVLRTYMGTLLPRLGNVTYSSAGQLSPLMNDPHYRTVGIGTAVFLGGAVGQVAWEGTQHNPLRQRGPNAVPVGPAGTVALIGDLKKMHPRYLRAAFMPGYGPTLYVGVGMAIPILDAELAAAVGVSDAEIFTEILDFAVPSRSRPSLGRVSYRELRSGEVELEGKRVPTVSLSSYPRAREIATLLKEWVLAGRFPLRPPVSPLPQDRGLQPFSPVPRPSPTRRESECLECGLCAVAPAACPLGVR